MVFSLIILVTGNRKMGGMAGLMPQPYVSVSLITPPCGHRPVCSRRDVSRVEVSSVLSSEIPPPRELGVAGMAELHRVPSARQEGRLKATPRGPPQET